MEPIKDWLILIYIAGDNSLSDEVAVAVAKIRAAAAKLKKHAVYVYYDTANSIADPEILDTTGPAHNRIRIPEIATGPVTVSGPPPSYFGPEQFVNYALAYAATQGVDFNRLAVVLSGHGDGFQETSLLGDDNPPHAMTVPDLAAMLRRINAGLVARKKKIDLVAFESCAMSSIENAVEFRGTADVMVAAQGDMGAAGWDYARFVDGLADAETKGTPLDPHGLGSAFGRALLEPLQDAARYADLSADVAITNIGAVATGQSDIEKAASAVHALGAALAVALADPNRSGLLLHVLHAVVLRAQGYLYDQYVDLFDFLGLLTSELDAWHKELSEQATRAGADPGAIPALLNSGDAYLVSLGLRLNDCVTLSGLTADALKAVDAATASRSVGVNYQYSNGLSIYLPWAHSSLWLMIPKYKRFAFGVEDASGTASGWLRFVSVLAEITLRPKRPDPRRTWEKMGTFLPEYFLTAIRGGGDGKPRGGGDGKPRGGGDGKPRGGAFLERVCRIRNSPTEW